MRGEGELICYITCARFDSASLSSLKRIKAFRQVSSILSTLSTNNWTMNLLWDVTCSLLIFITSSKTIRSWLRPLARASSLESGRFPEREPSILVVSVKINNYILAGHWSVPVEKLLWISVPLRPHFRKIWLFQGKIFGYYFHFHNIFGASWIEATTALLNQRHL